MSVPAHGPAAPKGWHDVYEVQMDLHRFWGTTAGAQTAAAFAEDVERRSGRTEYRHSTWRRLHEIEQQTLWQAAPFYVAPDMLDLVEAAAETFEPEPFLPTDLIASGGFVLLPRPKLFTDAVGNRVSFRAFAWMPAHEPDGGREGVWLSTYSHVDDMLTVEGGPTNKATTVPREGWPHQYMLLHGDPWWFGSTPTSRLAESRLLDDQNLEFADLANRQIWQFLQAFFRVSMQYIAVRERYEHPRPTRRRAVRMKMPKQDYVTVITLRRPKHKSGEPQKQVEWSHRWLRAGHWRNHYFPSLRTHRQIYINETICGPEDKPLVIRKGRAFRLAR